MTNPDNAVGTNAAYGGRTSVNAFNDDLGAYSRGILSGWACEPSSGLTVALGGAADTRDVAVAEDAGGNKTTINNISASPIEVTIGAAPASNTRIDAIVAYVDASPQGSATITDNYEACGLITVQGTASSTPVAPNESAIRTAITADGASGATAYYVVLAYITIANGTTTLTAANISAGEPAQLPSDALPNIPAGKLPTITADMLDFTTSIDANGWQKVSLSSKIIIYLKQGTASKTMAGNTWNETTASQKPVDLNISNTFFGGAGGTSEDRAINVSGRINTSGLVQIQNQNIYEGSVTTTINWWAFIVEIKP